MSATILAFLTYFSILLFIAYLSHQKMKNTKDFIVGDRSLNFWLTALSAHASDMSAWLFMALPSAVFLGGMPSSFIAIGLIVGMFLNWQLVATKLRVETEHYDTTTLSSFFEKRFHDKTPTLRILTALISLFFLVAYLSAGLIAMGRLLESVFDLNYFLSLGAATLVIIIYTFSGGFITIAWTDLFQALFLLGVIATVPCYALMQGNLFPSIIETASLKNIPLSPFSELSFKGVLELLFLTLSWGLGYFGQPHIITKFIGIKEAKDLKKSKYVGMTWQVLALASAILVGIVAIGFFPQGVENSELIFFKMVDALFSPYLGGFILCAVIAANMSTMDSQILVCASVLGEDLFPIFFKKSPSERKKLLFTRLSVIFISLLALGFAFQKNETILEAVLYAWSGLGASFGPIVLASLYFKKTTKTGAIAGILTGGIISACWQKIDPSFYGLSIPSMIPGFLLGSLAIYLGSKIKK